MNHWQLCEAFKGKTVEVYNGRRVRITGPATPGDVFCESVDGGEPIYSVSTAFLTMALREK